MSFHRVEKVGDVGVARDDKLKLFLMATRECIAMLVSVGILTEYPTTLDANGTEICCPVCPPDAYNQRPLMGATYYASTKKDMSPAILWSCYHPKEGAQHTGLYLLEYQPRLFVFNNGFINETTATAATWLEEREESVD